MKVIDERIQETRQKINSKAFGLAFYSLWAIIMYRMFVLQQSPQDYGDIFLLTIGLSAYIGINNVKAGSFTGRPPKNMNLLATLGLEVVYLILFSLAFKYLTGIESLGKIVAASAIYLSIRCMPLVFSKLSNHIVNKSLDHEEK